MVGNHHRKIWSAFFVLVTGYCLYQCKLNIDEYLKYDLLITVKDETVSAIDFPAITICPMLLYKKSTYGKITGYGYGLSELYSYSQKDMLALAQEVRCTVEHIQNIINRFKFFVTSLIVIRHE